ncbi:MAG TPA: type II toxin-antitoxin system HipA family toxin [Candidatus Baltobacteraceae bacterium]|jgi:serine/threonine-protein kinase HipA|nr:type II toxin-antitoxin system HipA family toxin [Candidatus Baltobacteraceae bacterium]
MKLKANTPLNVFLAFGSDERVLVGRLAMDGNVGVFEYAADFARHGLELNPLRRQHGSGLHRAAMPREFDGLHGIFSDSLPDAWGQALIRRLAGKRNVPFRSLTAIDKLGIVGQRGPGALVYEPALKRDDVDEINLDALANESLSILEGEGESDVSLLERVGGSSGGARPKALVGIDARGHIVAGDATLPDGYDAWIVKFRSSKNDLPDVSGLEATYAGMARAAGIRMAETRLLPAQTPASGYFATKRFDRRAGNRRLHMSSVCALAEAPWEYGSIDYGDLHNIVRYVTRDHQAVELIFRRMVFNVLAHNRDDHTKQHAFLMDENGKWQLAPAYDLTYSGGPGNEHYLAVNGRGGDDITVNDLLAVGRKQSLNEPAMREVIEQVSETVHRFGEFAAPYGTSTDTTREVSRVLEAELQRVHGRIVAIPSVGGEDSDAAVTQKYEGRSQEGEF